MRLIRNLARVTSKNCCSERSQGSKLNLPSLCRPCSTWDFLVLIENRQLLGGGFTADACRRQSLLIGGAQVACRRRAEASPKHGDEGTRVVIAELQGNCGHVNAAREELERAKQSSLLAPRLKRHLGLRDEQPTERSLTGASHFRPLFQVA